MKLSADHIAAKLHRRGVSVGGFTLIELIMVIVLIGVLAIFVAPRFFDSSGFNARGFHDENLAILRYAHNIAVAQRRTVCVVFQSSEPARALLSIASVAASETCNMSLVGPNKNCPDTFGGSSGCINAGSGVSYFSPSLTNVNFDGIGRPLGITSVLKIQIAVKDMPIAQTISIESETGYVHE